MNYFPNNKTKAFTLSFDDGILQDLRLIKLLDKYNVKCTFNINYGRLGNVSKKAMKGLKVVDYNIVKKEDLKNVYKDHEVGGHSLNHLHLETLNKQQVIEQITLDKQGLESTINKPLKVYAYPYGEYNDELVNILKDNGYIAARTIEDTYNFEIQKDLLRFKPTCHYADPRLMQLAEDFIKKEELSLFYVWGHSYEFDQFDNFEVMENLLKYLSKYKEEIWFATNGEIFEYLLKEDI